MRNTWTGMLAVVLLGLVTSGEARPGPGRIAVGGVYPNGYVGLLARYGLPRDMLSWDQMTSPEVLGGYDLVIVAGVAGDVTGLTAALDAVIAHGGSLLLDYGPPGRGIGRRSSRDSKPTFASPYYRVAMASRSGYRLNDPQALGFDDSPTFEPYSSREGGVAPYVDPDADTVVLANYLATTLPEQFERNKDRKRQPEPDKGPAMPAIVLETRGTGTILHCGASLGMATSIGGLDYDQLILAFLDRLTAGRAVPQLEPEGGHLGRKESARSLHEAADVDVDEAVDDTSDDDGLPPGPGSRSGLPDGFSLLEPDASPSYHISGRLNGQPLTLLLNRWNAGNQVRLDLAPGGAALSRTRGGKVVQQEKLAQALPAGTAVTVKVRDDQVVLLAADSLTTWKVGAPHQGLVAVKGGPGDLLYQPTEPVYFTDDFMRTDDSDGGWDANGGRWHTAPVQNPDMGANPFSYKVEPKGYATALQGYPFWDDYRADVALRAGAGDGWIGVGCYAQDPDNLLLFQAKVSDTATPVDDGFRLVRRERGQDQVLATTVGGLARGQWYQVRVKVEGPWFGAFVDGQKVLVATDRTWAGGRLALVADQVEARFDDVMVEPCNAPDDRGTRLVSRVPDYAGTMDLDSWAGPATPWDPDPAIGGLFWRRDVFFGDVGMRFDLRDLPDGASAALVTDANGRGAATGYAVRVTRRGAQGEVTLARNGQILAKGTAPLGETSSLSVRKKADRLVGMIDDRAVVEGRLTDSPVGGRLAFAADGFLPRVTAVAVWSLNLKDETFDAAPVRWWVGSGEWDVTNRWSCTPDWSWFGGFSKQIATVWFKQALEGDQTLDFYAGPKMMDESYANRERNGDFNAVLCGDGQSVDHGYAFIVAPKGGGARILKNGEVIAENKGFRIFGAAHNRWANVRAEKRGAQVILYVDDQQVVDYTDPEPLTGGFAGVWTQNNGIMIPRVTLSYEQLGDQMLSLPSITAPQIAILPDIPRVSLAENRSGRPSGPATG